MRTLGPIEGRKELNRGIVRARNRTNCFTRVIRPTYEAEVEIDLFRLS